MSLALTVICGMVIASGIAWGAVAAYRKEALSLMLVSFAIALFFTAAVVGFLYGLGQLGVPGLRDGW